MYAHSHGSDLVMDLLEAANRLESLNHEEIRELMRDAAAVLCELTPAACPAEARNAGCKRPGAAVFSLEDHHRKAS